VLDIGAEATKSRTVVSVTTPVASTFIVRNPNSVDSVL
jgi:hypothetical protein